MIVLRPMEYDDTRLIVAWRNDPDIRSHFVFREKFDVSMHEHWIRERIENKKDVVQWMICEAGEEGTCGRPVGSVYLRDIDRDSMTAEYGIFIGEPDAVSRGIGTEAARRVMELAKGMGLKKLCLRVFDDNERAKKSYLKAGFVPVKRLKDVRCSDGEMKDMIYMETELQG